jgi:DNA-binding response OmpR family regulator
MVAEDDFALSLFLRKGLELEGHAVQCIGDGATALSQIHEKAPDLLVLDLGLPRMDGVDVLRALHGKVPEMSIMILTGRSQRLQKVECLNLGADDYLIKPFSLQELLARCRALARRGMGVGNDVLQIDGLRMDRLLKSVTYNLQTVGLTAKEFTLLEYLLQKKGRAVSRQELMREVWHMSLDSGSNVVDVYVNYLRRKLRLVGSADMIETVRGEGYGIGFRSGATKRTSASSSSSTAFVGAA